MFFMCSASVFLLDALLSQNQCRSSISRLSGNDKSTLKKDKETVLDLNRVIQEEEDDVKIKIDSTKNQKVEIELTPIEQLKPENNIGKMYLI